MKYNKKILYTITALCLTLGLADASSLVNLDLKKSSDNTVDMTFFTTGASTTPMVTNKGNNKYVILMPNVSGSNANTPSLGGVKDLITDINVKNVDDGMNGYTKVTLTTTKPINIKTYSKKAAPLSAEEKQAKAIIAQVKTKPVQTQQNNISQDKIKQNPAPTNAKTTQKSQPFVSNTIKTTDLNKSTKNTTKKQVENKKPAVKTTAAPTVQNKVLTNNTNATPKTNNTVTSEGNKTPTAQNEIPNKTSNPKKTVKPQSHSDNIDHQINYAKRIAKSARPYKDYSGLLLLLIPIFGLYLLAKGLKNSLQSSDVLKSSFKEHLSEKPNEIATYDNIINNDELNWQEKYKQFVEESKGEIKQPQYHFIKPLNTIDKKRLELENTLEKTPDIYKNTKIETDEKPLPKVQAEEHTINENLSKLKAFANPVSLKSTQRNKKLATSSIKSDYTRIAKFSELKHSELNSTSRHFKNGALKVSDLISTSNKYSKENAMDSINEDFVMSSMDEYLSILDKENELVTAPKDLSSKVADTLSNLKPSMHIAPSSIKNSTNPIKQSRSKTPDGLIIKAGYNIDENRGFYIANVDGLNSLIGRINNETFVLKTFDSSVNNLQVRPDGEGVYVVKAGDFRALVNVEEDKMGVLLEL